MAFDAELVRLVPAPRELAAYVGGFVHRLDERGGEVVSVFPHARSTVQLMLADAYWLKEADTGATWRRLPRIALWGPRLIRGYGFAARRICSYGFSVTPAGMCALWGRPPGAFVNKVSDLARIDIALSAELFEAGLALNFDAWMDAVCGMLRKRFALMAPATPVAAAFDLLASANVESIAGLAQQTGLSERQFRRLFACEFGAPAKIYQRVLRFDRTLRALHPEPWERPPPDGAGGYADQPHLIREFRTFTGVTPGAYVRSKESRGDLTLRNVVVSGVAPPGL